MIRFLLVCLCAALALAVGLWTACVQSENRALALELDRTLERCRMLEALNGALKTEILALDWGPEIALPAASAALEIER